MRFHLFPFRSGACRSGYTLVEIMLATGLSLLLLASAVRIFLTMNEGFSQSRSLMEMMGRMRNAMDLLQKDLGHKTVRVQPPRPIQADDGYFVIGTFPVDHANWDDDNLKGFVDMGVVSIDSGSNSLRNFKVDPFLCGMTKPGALETDLSSVDKAINDGTFNSHDLFNNVNGFVGLTICNFDEPFRYIDENNKQRETPYGEVIWFVYRNCLYRAFMPIVAARDRSECAVYYEGQGNNDAAKEWGNVPYMPRSSDMGLPSYRKINLGMLGDPRYRLLSAYTRSGSVPTMLYNEYLSSSGAENNPYVWGWLYRYFLAGGGSIGSAGEAQRKQLLLDSWLILPNVIQFTAEVWDPMAKKYITLGPNASNYYTLTHDFTTGTVATARKDLTYCYDTWSTLLCNMSHAAKDDGELKEMGTESGGYMVGTTEGGGTFNSTLRSIASPPYTAPLPGVRIRVRAFDPDTGQAKEFHVAQDFMAY